MAKISLGKLSTKGFTDSMARLIELEIPVRTAFKLKTLVNSFNQELVKFQELRNEIVERHCKRGDDGKPLIDEGQNYTFDGDKLKIVTSEINELAAIEVDFTPIKVEELGNISVAPQLLFEIGDVIDA